METSYVSLFLTAIGIACILEALPWLIAPQKMISFLIELAHSMKPENLRYWGLALLMMAVLFIWLGKRMV